MFENFLEKNKQAVVLFLAGIMLLGLGVLVFRVNEVAQEPEIAILGEQEEEFAENSGSGKILVEIAGEVIKPGVYELGSGSRVNDLLTLAGGLSVKADRDWVAKNINLAQKLIDGAKIYIPEKNASNSQDSSLRPAESAGLAGQAKININTASQSELESLWGIGPVTAKKIIGERPFTRIDELLEKKIVKSNVWEAIKDEITVY